MKTKLLIVEDQAEIRKLIRLTLELGDYEVYEAQDGDSALDALKTFKPDLALLDVMMPGAIDGYRLCRIIKGDATLSTKVIFLSARGQKADLAEGQAAGGDDYVLKPFSPLALIETIERVRKGGENPRSAP